MNMTVNYLSCGEVALQVLLFSSINFQNRLIFSVL